MAFNILPVIQAAAFSSMMNSRQRMNHTQGMLSHQSPVLGSHYPSTPSSSDATIPPSIAAMPEYKLAMGLMTTEELDKVKAGEIVGLEVFDSSSWTGR
jgi:hypothetical protein